MKSSFSCGSTFFIIIALSAILCCPLYAQFPRLNFKNFTEKDGLSTNYVRSIYQDKDGFMWFGTPFGLDKFDGKNFTNYNSLLRDTLSSNYQIAYDIIEDNAGILWIATYSNGIILFDKNSETITRLKHDVNDPSSLSNDRVLDIFKDKDANIWVATAGGGLDLWQKDYRNFTHFRHDPLNKNSIGSDYVSSVVSDSKGVLWILSVDGIISKFNPETGIFENIVLPLISHNVILRRGNSPVIYVDSDDNILAAAHYGLFILDSQSGKIKHFPEFNSHFSATTIITSILEIQKGIIALTTNFQGLYLLNTKTSEYINYSNNPNSEYFLNTNAISSVYISRNGLLWVGSWDAGINMYNKEFSQFQILSETVKTGKEFLSGTRGAAFCISPDNKIWIATGNKEIVAYDPIEKTVKQVLKGVCKSTVNCLYSNTKGEVFIGTTEDGLIVFDFWKNKLKFLSNDPKNPNSIASNYTFCMLLDSENKVWMSFIGTGLDVWDRSINKIKHFKYNANDKNSLISDVIYKMCEDQAGRIWIGTQNGLCYYTKDNQSFTRYPLYVDKNKNVQVNTILDIFKDSKGDIWVGTSNAIFKISHIDLSCTLLTPQNELPFLVTNIMEDQDHNIWMTSYNKLFKFNSAKQEFSVYNFYNGNKAPTFLGFGSLSANNQFYLGSMDRIITFNPGDIIEDTLKPEIFFTDLKIYNTDEKSESSKVLTENINFTKSLKLDYKQTTFSLVFAAIEYSYPEKIQYAYKLENFDKDWIYLENLANRAAYTKVPPGIYVFKVKATNRRGEWFESDKNIAITIKPPVWETWWFRVLVLIVLLAAIWGIYSFRVRKFKLQRKELEETVKMRTRALKEANVSLEEQHKEVIQQNELLSKLSKQILNQNKELEGHYNKLEILVDERTKELKEAKNKAEESDKLKSAFLANMSHEIRTPMNAIVGFANLLKDEHINTEEKNEFIEIINTNSDSLLMLIGDILDISIIEANQLVIRNEVFDVNEFLDHLYSSFLLLNSNQNVKLILCNKLNLQKLKIRIDKLRTTQILTNLINNALKFTAMGIVELGLKMHGNQLAFYVKDTGIGIPEKDIERIFERFRKSEDDKSILYRGAGLGLAISRALSRLMEGNLTAESEFGKGSVFTLFLPDTIISNEETKVPETQVLIDTGSIANKNILIAEDEKANYLYLEKMLSKTNTKIYRAENGLEAVEMVDSGINFHLILMDIKMPVMDGFEATKRIRSKVPNQVIIAITAYASEEEKLKFMEAGFDAYLTKPLYPSEFKNILKKYLEKL
jgi:signal transduction histidine kinase/ligand-binding sensor domain-containing protein/CheY-like chemotaxis protein